MSSIEELRELESRWAMPTYARFDTEFARADGARLWDSQGREYIDFFAGLGVHNAGHCHPAIASSISEQAAIFDGSSNLYYSEPALRLCEALSGSSLGGKVFLANSGTEANEAAIKLVRKHAHQRGVENPVIVSLESGFHGRSMAPLAATPKLAREDLFGPLPQGFVSVPRDDAESMRQAIGPETAAVLIEPIQGEAGVWPIAEDVLIAAREACDAHGALLVFDEVQTGMGRTGSLWAYEQLPVRPDVITAAKALGGGLPVGACVITPELGDGLIAGEHGSTFGGGPIAARAALAALGVLGEEALLANARERGEQLRSALAALDAITDVRGRGLMVGVTLADGIDSAAVARSALEAGVVLNVPGPGMLRMLPPLVIGSDEIEAGVERLAAVL